ncbi:MAG: zinc-ribbon domain-containing protein [Myxococcaceae bacterium]|nr:zinc-ribbon domain-containing protein [Myxococcaceae bacterium]
MHISCEKCATTYVLDDAIIPPQGAPVQCTKCGHVFTARLPRPAAPAAVPAPMGATMMFGAGGAPPPAAPQPSRTVMFGAAGAPAPASVAPAPASSTMMFGAVGAPGPAPAPAAVPPAAQPSRTVMFGAPGAPSIPPAPAPASSTMMFGAVGAPGPAPAPNQPVAPLPSKTVMFGAPGSPSIPAAPAPANSTMMFGAVGAPGPAPVASQPVAPLPSKTVMFGAPGAPSIPAAPAPANSTMMFGAVGAPGPAPVASQPVAPLPSKTVMFGVPGGPSLPSAPAPASSTMMFGAVQAPDPTMAPTAPGFAPAGEPPRPSSTMMFGAPSVPEPKLSESTVRMGPEEVQRMMAEHQAQTSEGAGRHQKTQMFAMSPDDASQRPTAPAAAPGPARGVSVDPSLVTTLPPDAPRPSLSPSPRPRGGSEGDLLSTTIPHAPSPAAQPRPAPAPRATPVPQLRAPSPVTQPTSPTGPDDAVMQLQQAVQRRNRIALIVIVVALLGVVGLVAFKVVGPKLFGRSVPVEALSEVEAALVTLRRDDDGANAEALAALRAVEQKYPAVLEAKAGVLLALVLNFDEVQFRLGRLQQGIEQRNRRIEKYNQEHSADHEAKASALFQEASALTERAKPLTVIAGDLRTAAAAEFKALNEAQTRQGELSPQTELAVQRASGMFFAIAGSDQTVKALVSLKVLTQQTPDGWSEMMRAEYALNTRAKQEDGAEAVKELETLLGRDPSFLRARMLRARLYLVGKHTAEAKAEIDALLKANPQHQGAKNLQEWLEQERP